VPVKVALAMAWTGKPNTQIRRGESKAPPPIPYAPLMVLVTRTTKNIDTGEKEKNSLPKQKCTLNKEIFFIRTLVTGIFRLPLLKKSLNPKRHRTIPTKSLKARGLSKKVVCRKVPIKTPGIAPHTIGNTKGRINLFSFLNQ